MNQHLSTGYAELYKELQTFIPAARLITDPLRTLAYGSDASFYRLIPKLVVKVMSEQEISRILQLARKYGTPVTFRAAGTSLSGQAVTDSVLLMLGDGWRDYEINGDASEIRLQPGVVGGHANRYLAPFNRKIGPDPGSIDHCKIGGIAANNASGMCCGTAQNSYQTLASMRVILADGSTLDTGDDASRRAFARSHADLLDRIRDLGRSTRADTSLVERIRAKYKIKNTTGYSLNALVDFEDPIDILQHLMIGSEGTLGFIAEITYRTVVEHPHKASALVLFPDVETACQAVAVLKAEPVSAVELIDRAAIRSVEGKPGIPNDFMALPEDAAGLLIETRAADGAVLQRQIDAIIRSIARVRTLFPAHFTDKVAEYTNLWNIRKGLFPSLGAMRESGTTLIIEDVAFPVPQLAAATLDLQSLFKQHGYHDAIIFGHALEGNLHFVFAQDFATPAEIERYHRFMEDVCDMVARKYDGSLKAEHSTGRNMAPYVEFEWGSQAYRLMQEIKSTFDPDGILNPGVILNDDPQVHLKNLKPMFRVDPLVDKCIECGYCELTCPSNDLTLTPRQRIVALRELARLEASGEENERTAAMRRMYQYQGVETCAADGLCAVSCPVDINTGQMTKVLRGRQVGAVGHKTAAWVAGHFALAASATRAALGAANAAHALLGSPGMGALARGIRRLSGNRIPLWNPYLPTAGGTLAPKPIAGESHRPRIVYFPSCVSRIMAPARGDPERDPLPAKTEALLRKAGYEVVYPKHCEPLCCGMPFESKGLADEGDTKLRELEAALLEASRNGRDPILVDSSPCAWRMKQSGQADLEILDVTECIHDRMMDKLTFRKLPGPVALHPTCSVLKMGLNDKLRTIAEACAEQVIVPEHVSCCGFAGDRGFTQPELNESALRNLRASLPDDCDSGYSTSRTCEIGLSLHSGRYYRSIVYLVDLCTNAKAGATTESPTAGPGRKG